MSDDLLTRQHENYKKLKESMKTNCSYSRLFFTSSEFANEEFAKAGIDIDSEAYMKMVNGYKMLRDGLTIAAKQSNKRLHMVFPFTW